MGDLVVPGENVVRKQADVLQNQPLIRRLLLILGRIGRISSTYMGLPPPVGHIAEGDARVLLGLPLLGLSQSGPAPRSGKKASAPSHAWPILVM